MKEKCYIGYNSRRHNTAAPGFGRNHAGLQTGQGLGDKRAQEPQPNTYEGRVSRRFEGTPNPPKKERGKKDIYGSQNPGKDGYLNPKKVKN